MSAPKGEFVGRVDPKRLLWVGPLTLLASVIAVTCIRQIAVSVLNPNPKFLPLTAGPPVFDTVLFGGMAIFAFFRMCSYARQLLGVATIGLHTVSGFRGYERWRDYFTRHAQLRELPVQNASRPATATAIVSAWTSNPTKRTLDMSDYFLSYAALRRWIHLIRSVTRATAKRMVAPS